MTSILISVLQSSELAHLAPQDVAAQAKIMSANPSWGPNSICLTCSFTPGSISLSAFEITVAGFEWGRKAQDVLANPAVSPVSRIDVCGLRADPFLSQGFNPSMAQRVQLLLSDRILGTTLVPEGKTWNYSVGLTQQFSPTMPYTLTLDTPISFWAEEHRPAPFLNFASMESGDDSADVENALA
jgi:pre-mRNA-processing factor 8